MQNDNILIRFPSNEKYCGLNGDDVVLGKTFTCFFGETGGGKEIVFDDIMERKIKSNEVVVDKTFIKNCRGEISINTEGTCFFKIAEMEYHATLDIVSSWFGDLGIREDSYEISELFTIISIVHYITTNRESTIMIWGFCDRLSPQLTDIVTKRIIKICSERGHHMIVITNNPVVLDGLDLKQDGYIHLLKVEYNSDGGGDFCDTPLRIKRIPPQKDKLSHLWISGEI
jgi:hypothetical protein